MIRNCSAVHERVKEYLAHSDDRGVKHGLGERFESESLKTGLKLGNISLKETIEYFVEAAIRLAQKLEDLKFSRSAILVLGDLT